MLVFDAPMLLEVAADFFQWGHLRFAGDSARTAGRGVAPGLRVAVEDPCMTVHCDGNGCASVESMLFR